MIEDATRGPSFPAIDIRSDVRGGPLDRHRMMRRMNGLTIFGPLDRLLLAHMQALGEVRDRLVRPAEAAPSNHGS